MRYLLNLGSIQPKILAKVVADSKQNSSIIPFWQNLQRFSASGSPNCLFQEDQRALHCKSPKMKLLQKIQHNPVKKKVFKIKETEENTQR